MVRASDERLAELRMNLEAIKDEISRASKGKAKKPRLVLASKLKPPSDILAAHEAGQEFFGENYVQELQEKAEGEQLPASIKWHFFGHLQTNKAKALASIPNLYALETLDSTKKADIIEKVLAESDRRLRVYLQYNTSQEDQKGGVRTVEELRQLAEHVRSSCPHLDLVGLMTIGSYEASHGDGKANPDFQALRDARDELGEPDFELSMGMTADYATAIEQFDSSNVRVGSAAFGSRPSKEEAKAKREEEKAQA